MAEKDILSKHLFKRIAIDMAVQLFGLNVSNAELLETEFQRVEDRRADLLLSVKAPTPFLLHIEVQNNNHPLMPERMLRYRLDIQTLYGKLPIQQYVVYIGQEKLKMPNKLQQNNLDYEYHLIDIRDIDYQHFLQHDTPDALVLAVLCDFKGKEPREMVRYIVQRLEALLANNEAELREYLNMLEMLSSNRDLQDIVYEEENMLTAIQLSDLPSFQEGRQEGRQEGQQEGWQKGRQAGRQEGERQFLLRLLKKKFGNLPAHIEQKLLDASGEQLALWGDNVLTAETLHQVFQK